MLAMSREKPIRGHSPSPVDISCLASVLTNEGTGTTRTSRLLQASLLSTDRRYS
jgi:hypothetical protein